ncbi:MAG: PAS domain S-box protein, partial [Bacteroidales bacterium]|nr:PAS domain S-box protein [Bacteroidales bacterium]
MSSLFSFKGIKKIAARRKLHIGVNKPFKKGLLKHIRGTQDCMRASQNMYQNLVELAHEGITMADPYDNLTYINKQFAKSLGYKVDELVGRNLTTLSTKDTAARMRKGTEKRKKGLKSRYEVTLYHRDGNKKHFMLSTSPIFGSNREFLGSMGVYADVTEKKIIEIKLEKKVKQIDTLYRVYVHARMVKTFNRVLSGIAQEVVQAFPYNEYVHSKLFFDHKTYCYPSAIDRFHHKIET